MNEGCAVVIITTPQRHYLKHDYQQWKWIIEESNGNECLTLIAINERKDTVQRYERVCSNVQDLIRSKNHDSVNSDEKYINNIFSSNDDSPLKKTLELHDIIIVARSVFSDNNRCYPQVFLDDFCTK